MSGTKVPNETCHVLDCYETVVRMLTAWSAATESALFRQLARYHFRKSEVSVRFAPGFRTVTPLLRAISYNS